MRACRALSVLSGGGSRIRGAQYRARVRLQMLSLIDLRVAA